MMENQLSSKQNGLRVRECTEDDGVELANDLGFKSLGRSVNAYKYQLEKEIQEEGLVSQSPTIFELFLEIRGASPIDREFSPAATTVDGSDIAVDFIPRPLSVPNNNQLRITPSRPLESITRPSTAIIRTNSKHNVQDNQEQAPRNESLALVDPSGDNITIKALRTISPPVLRRSSDNTTEVESVELNNHAQLYRFNSLRSGRHSQVSPVPADAITEYANYRLDRSGGRQRASCCSIM